MKPATSADHAAAVDVAHHDHGHIGRTGEAHVGDVAGAQVHFRGAARALHQHDVGGFPQAGETVEHKRQQRGLHCLVVAGAGAACHAALHDDLRADLALRLQQHGVHVDAGRHAGGAGLQRLGAADLAAIRGDGGVVGHVLRLERQHAQAATQAGAGQPRDEQGLADAGPGALQHDRPRGQNSMPSCARTPAAK
jgi:hypothetical protein